MILSWLAGCAAPVREVKGSPAVTVLVRLVGGGTLSPGQLANIHRSLQNDIKAAGYHFAANSHVADLLVTVRFTPDALNPDFGHVAVTSIEPNPLNRRGSASLKDVSEEEKELRRKVQDIERWTESQARTST